MTMWWTCSAALGLDVVEPPAHLGADEARVDAHEEEGGEQADEEPGHGGAGLVQPGRADGVGGDVHHGSLSSLACGAVLGRANGAIPGSSRTLLGKSIGS